ncbi:angio-associated migratory cell protein isoform X1 [Pogonomyrmex barbatus]|uniref:Angio-associated migratory cell protein isoform X1 n=2 Tax=Pogonomyrmex barbatus TaxID=144034 RepID=A0A6I9XCX6_9HYME|nr:angio-associated migratory cell protein isoform X1 [Pogonomyrmex barbatus]
MMQDKQTPPSPPDVSAVDIEEMVFEEDIEEVIDLDEVIMDGMSSLEDEDDKEVVPPREDAVCIFRGHTSGNTVFCGSLSKNGELAATGSEENKACIWDINTGETIFDTGTTHDDSIIFAEFNFNDKYVATADMCGKIQLWKISNKTCVWETTLASDISWIKWHYFSNILVAGVETGEVYMLKTRTDECKIFAQGTGDKTETGVIFPDGKHAAIGYHSGVIHVIELKSNIVLSTTPRDSTRSHGHASYIVAIDCHMDNNLLISVSIEGQTILSTAHNGKVICVLQDLNIKDAASNDYGNVETAAFCKDPTFPVAATGTIENEDHGKIYIWDISKQTLRHEIDQNGGITKLMWTKTSILFTAGLDSVLRCFDARAGICLQEFSGHTNGIYDLYISSDDKKVLTVSDDSTARIFDISMLT